MKTLSMDFVSWSLSLVNTWGYLGIFLINLLGSATIIFPVPSFAVVFVLGSILNPWLLGFFAALGSAFGEFTGYLAGLGGRSIGEKKLKKWFDIAEKWVKKHGFFFVIFIFAATPLPMDVIGIFSGAVRYNPKKFFLAVFLGKLIVSWVLAWGGFFGIKWLLNFFS